LIYVDETKGNGLSNADYEALVVESADYDDELGSSGRCVASHLVNTNQRPVAMRVWKGQVTTMDAPASTNNDQLAGVLIVQATDFNSAITMASRAPFARLGHVEVHLVRE
jgi:hypothetical protein